MERLTIKSECADNIILKAQRESSSEASCKDICEFMNLKCDNCPIQKAKDRLSQYENTGYNPKELKEIKSRLSGAADTINMLSPLMMENYELKKERDHWKREAIKWCAELGEQKLYKAWLDSAKE